MATITLNWTPVNDSNSSSQDVEYRGKTAGGTFTKAHTALGKAIATADITALANNTVFECKVINNCVSGGPTPSALVEAVLVTCVGALTTSATDVAIDVSFSHLGADVDKYDITLQQGTTVIATTAKTGPFAATVSHQFTGLVSGQTYDIHVKTHVGAKNTSCLKATVTTLVCNAPTAVSATIS